jgi:hypothetical protein
LREALQERKADVLHIIAHGDPGSLLWQTDAGNPQWRTAEELRETLSGLSLRLVVLSICYSAFGSTDQDSLSVAALRSGAESVIGMKGILGDSEAAAFSQSLYRSLILYGTRDVETLMAEARKGISMLTYLDRTMRTWQWAVPALFSSGPSNAGLPASRCTSMQLSEPSSVVGEVRPQAGLPGVAVLTVRHKGEVKEVMLTRNEPLYFGRSRSNTVVMTDPQCAPFIARLSLSAEADVVLDSFDHSNPARLNGEPAKSARIKDRDIIEIGEVQITIKSRQVEGHSSTRREVEG